MMMLDPDKRSVDLSVVKQECDEMEEYGHDTGNILDNFVQDYEHDYNEYPTNMPCSDDRDIDVDWLSSFFDEPSHDNMSSLNPALTDIVSTSNVTHSISKVTSIETESDSLLLETFGEMDSDDFINSSSSFKSTHGMKSTCISSPTVRHNNPLLSQTDVEMRPVKKEIIIEDSTNIKMPVKIAPAINVDRFSKPNDKQNQQKLLLFMNTPENRAKLAGTNYNIINANVLSKISPQNCPKKINSPENIISLKNCIKLNTTIKQEPKSPSQHDQTDDFDYKSGRGLRGLPIRRDCINGITDILQNSLSQGMRGHEKDNSSLDSGYESPGHSPTSSPGSPEIDVESNDGMTNYLDTIHHVDVPPHERQPFFLSPEERRTLIAEGLPVPVGLPLTKIEERALKKVRRKIKNKISAQESRRKKKEYMETLEKKVDTYMNDNGVLKKKISTLEVANRSLLIQVQKLQNLLSAKSDRERSNSAVQTEDVMSA